MKLHFFTAIFVLLLTLLTSAYSATNHSRTTAVNGTSTTLRPVDPLTNIKNETTSSASWDHPTQFNHFKDSLECCQPIERRDLSYADTHLQRLNYNFMQNSMDFDSTFFYFNAQIGILNEITKRGQEDIIAPSKQPLLSLSQLHSLMYAFKTKISACASTSPARSAGDNLVAMSFNDDINRFNSEFLQLYKKINDGIVVEDVRTFITGVIDELLFLLGKMIKNCFGKYMIESVNDNSQGLITLNNICVPSDSRLTEYEEGLFAKIYPQMKDEIIEVIKETVATNTETNMRGVIDANEIVKEALKRDYKVITLELLKNANDETIRTIKGLLEKEQSVKENPME